MRFRVFKKPEFRTAVIEEQAMLGAACEHAIRLGRALGDQIVDEDTDVGFMALDDQRWRSPRLRGGINAGDQTLSGGFLITGGAVDLAGQKEILDLARLQ